MTQYTTFSGTLPAKPKIYILDAFHEAGIALARQHADVVCWPDPAIHEWPEHADGVMLRMTPVTAEQLARARYVKVICKQGVGYETIDISAARARGIPVCRTPGVNSEAVAEMAFALALTVARRVARFDRLLRAGSPIVRPQHLGIELQGKTVGIVGMGNIGTCVARKWHGAFGAKLLAYAPRSPVDHWSDLPHSRASSLHALLPQVDVLSLHLPLTPESRHMIGRRELAMMKKDAILINVSRGGLIDEQALVESMAGGHLFGAGLDVFEVEPPTADHPLLQLDNVVATPHAAGGATGHCRAARRPARTLCQLNIRHAQAISTRACRHSWRKDQPRSRWD
jgi:D-3-phosphoglycerate dehydrogenase